jgi:hypothetical protein
MPAPRPASAVPAFAAAVAGAYLISAIALPAALPVVLVAATTGACASVLVRRPRGALWAAIALIAAWLAWGLAGAWWLRGSLAVGLGWIVLVLFLLPLPLVPWLYARTFRPLPEDRGHGDGG